MSKNDKFSFSRKSPFGQGAVLWLMPPLIWRRQTSDCASPEKKDDNLAVPTSYLALGLCMMLDSFLRKVKMLKIFFEFSPK